MVHSCMSYCMPARLLPLLGSIRLLLFPCWSQPWTLCRPWLCAAVALTPNVKVSAVVSSNFYSLANLFAGFVAPRPVRPSCNRHIQSSAYKFCRSAEALVPVTAAPAAATAFCLCMCSCTRAAPHLLHWCAQAAAEWMCAAKLSFFSSCLTCLLLRRRCRVGGSGKSALSWLSSSSLCKCCVQPQLCDVQRCSSQAPRSTYTFLSYCSRAGCLGCAQRLT